MALKGTLWMKCSTPTSTTRFDDQNPMSMGWTRSHILALLTSPLTGETQQASIPGDPSTGLGLRDGLCNVADDAGDHQNPRGDSCIQDSPTMTN